MKLAGRDLWDSSRSYHEVWYSPTQFQADDAVSKGFVCLTGIGADDTFAKEAQRAWLKQHGKHYTLSSISTTITGRLDWNRPLDLPDFPAVSFNH